MARVQAYTTIIAEIFRRHYQQGLTSFDFPRAEFEEFAHKMEVQLPKNVGDIPYHFRFRYALPREIIDTAPEGLEWIIELAGHAKYRFRLCPKSRVIPNPSQLQIKIPNATPEIISAHALNDEQALLAIVRYNRLIDVFLGLTSFSLQNHLRTTVKDIGQIEIDEVYVGINKKGAQFIIPVQAKGGRDKIGTVQTAQDIACCQQKFPTLLCRPISAQFMSDKAIAMFELALVDSEIRIVDEKHYRLVPAHEITGLELKKYGESE